MTRYTFILFALFFSAAIVRADLVLEQQSGDTNHTRVITMKIHGDKMRADEVDSGVSVIVDLNQRDSITLLEKSKMYLNRLGSEIRWQMEQERKASGGTNDLDAAPVPPVDTGKTETINGREAEIYTWSGARGLVETLWVDRNFSNYDAIKTELFKLDKFNDTGPHRNAQPQLSLLPGMVIKSVGVIKGHTNTTALLSVKLETVDASIFDIPSDYSAYKAPEHKSDGTNAPH